MSVGIKRIVTELITIGFIVSIRLVDNQVSMRVRRENVLVMEHRQVVQVVEFVVNSNYLIRGPMQV